MEMEEIIEKLKDILASEGHKKVKNSDVANALKIHPDTFNSMKFRNSIPYKQILNFLEGRNININYFFFGSSPQKSAESEEKYKILKLYKANASLGNGGINDFIECQDIYVDCLLLDFLNVKNCEFITSIGDSMESIIQNGSICVIDREKPFRNGDVYMVNTKDGIFIKQVFKNKEGVILHSFNPNYNDVFYSNGDFLLIGAFIGEIRKYSSKIIEYIG